MNPRKIDRGNPIDCGKTSKDYSAWRPNYPDRFFDVLAAFGVGLTGQRILDLGTCLNFTNHPVCAAEEGDLFIEAQLPP